MANINLLPWRDQQRSERNRTTFLMCVGMWAVACLLVFVAKMVMDGRIDSQLARNNYLQNEINSLSKVIREIDKLKEKRDKLVARMEVIQTLQENRAQIVHVFDDLVAKIPKGVYFNNISKTGGRINIAGTAQSNNRVSNLMRNLDSSDWFDNSSLKVVDIIDQNGARVSSFNVEVKEEKKQSDDGIEAIN